MKILSWRFLRCSLVKFSEGTNWFWSSYPFVLTKFIPSMFFLGVHVTLKKAKIGQPIYGVLLILINFLSMLQNIIHIFRTRICIPTVMGMRLPHPRLSHVPCDLLLGQDEFVLVPHLWMSDWSVYVQKIFDFGASTCITFLIDLVTSLSVLHCEWMSIFSAGIKWAQVLWTKRKMS